MISSERGETLLSRLPLSRLSFRWQIALLGTLVFILFVAVLSAVFGTLRYTKSAVLNDEKKQLIQITQNLAREYEDKAEVSRQSQEAPPLNNPASAASRELLALLSRVVLQDADGVSGGFYSRRADAPLGYPFTNYEGLAENKDTPASERDAILQVARNAATTRQPAERVLSSGRGLLLMEAVPIRDGSSVVGSAWTVKRLPSLPGSNRFRAYLITAALGLAALASVLLTLLVIRNLQVGVRKIESGLQSLETNLGKQIESDHAPEEIQRIVEAINRLRVTLVDKINREKQIESQLRHSERLASLGRLVAGVAHEVRNPLATIRLRVQMCLRAADTKQVTDSCSIALQEIERLNGMVNRLLAFARPVQLHRESSNLRDLVEQRIDSFRESASKAGVTMVANLPHDPLILEIDKNRMAQVFDNMIQNALDAMSDGGTLSVSLSAQEKTTAIGAGICVEFRDTGAGMSSSVADHVFDPFFTTKPTGTGLGLSISHELVQAHGGDIEVASEEGRGTCVRIRIPVSHA
jgi:signal transduction histidine kinase